MGLSDAIHRFKSLTTAKYMTGVNDRGWPAFNGKLWHRSYHDHIIRDGNEWSRIREYIRLNPTQWAQDKENPHETGTH